MFNLKSETEVYMIRLMALSEGVLKREDFPTKNLFYKMKNAGYIKKCGKSYKITDKFKKEYTKTVDKAARFSSTGSSLHERGVLDVLKAIPPKPLASVQSAAQLAEYHKAYSKTADYKAVVSKVRQHLQEQKQELQAQIKNTRTDLTAARLRQNIREISRFERKLDDRHRGVSPCDLRISMSRDEASEMIDNLRTKHPDAAKQLKQIVDASQTQTVQVLFEITTPNYAAHQIFSHEVYAETVNLPVIFIPAA